MTAELSHPVIYSGVAPLKCKQTQTRHLLHRQLTKPAYQPSDIAYSEFYKGETKHTKLNPHVRADAFFEPMQPHRPRLNAAVK